MADMEWRIYHPDSCGSGIVLCIPQKPEKLRQLADDLERTCAWLEKSWEEGVPPLCTETMMAFPLGHAFEAAMVHMDAAEMAKAAEGALPLASTGKPFDPEVPQLLTAEEAESILGIDEDCFLFESAVQKIEAMGIIKPTLSTEIMAQDGSAFGWMSVEDARHLLTEAAERLEAGEAETPRP